MSSVKRIHPIGLGVSNVGEAKQPARWCTHEWTPETIPVSVTEYPKPGQVNVSPLLKAFVCLQCDSWWVLPELEDEG